MSCHTDSCVEMRNDPKYLLNWQWCLWPKKRETNLGTKKNHSTSKFPNHLRDCGVPFFLSSVASRSFKVKTNVKQKNFFDRQTCTHRWHLSRMLRAPHTQTHKTTNQVHSGKTVAAMFAWLAVHWVRLPVQVQDLRVGSRLHRLRGGSNVGTSGQVDRNFISSGHVFHQLWMCDLRHEGPHF